VSIDGRKLKVRAGTTILEAASRVGIEIPTFCHIPGLRPTGVCRVCVVEVSGSRTLVASCHTPVADGMEIRTRSPRVMVSRRAVIELMLAAHTGECVTDPNAERCLLHKLASDQEVGAPRFPIGAPRSYPVEEESPYIRRDLSKCILCRRCITACREIAGKGELAVAYRGFSSKVIAGCDEPLDTYSCKDCGICIEHCPTGALARPSGEGAPARETLPPGRALKKPPHEPDGAGLLNMLKQAAAGEGRISRGAMEAISHKTGLSLTDVYAAASFYTFLPIEHEAENRIRICRCAPCEIKGAPGILSRVSRELGIGPGETTADGKFSLAKASCIGACDKAPALMINERRYTGLAPEKIGEILKAPPPPVEKPAPLRPPHPSEHRIALKHCGRIDPDDIDSYLSRGGFSGLKKARTLKPRRIVEEIKLSGLTGRGGAGFSCGLKWGIAQKQRSREKYLVCNADEGEVGTFKDRYILMHDPFGLIEGMTIAGLALGAKQAYIYLRAEYHDLGERLAGAVEQATIHGFLDHMEIKIFEGAGAYICGEETALLDSIEGRRGEARYKPPYPPVEGLWGRPTIVNNVETLMNVAPIIENGHYWFSALGTEKSRGTKVFCVSGDVPAPGVYEMPMGTPLEELIVNIAGAEDVLAVQVGGAAGRILPPAMLDTPLCHETCLGSGAVTVFNLERDIVSVVYNNLRFLHEESCGKCTPCRDGLEAMTGIYERFAEGLGTNEDLRALEELARAMAAASLCGLGQSAPTPVLDSLAHFRYAYEDRIRQSAYLRNLHVKERIKAF
jgi:NADH-quinone oxidoreductase subunit F